MLSRAALCALALPLVTACAAARTTAAAPPGSPTAFDPSKSDPKAVAVADQVLATVGGPAWAGVKELRWTTEILDGDKAMLHAEQSWDRWNGRAYLKNVPVAEGSSPTVAMYELYGDTATAIVVSGSGIKERANAENTREILAKAKERFGQDQYWVTMHLRLKDPGVHLKFVEERPAEGSTSNDPKYDVLQLSFDPGVGPPPEGATYFLIVDKASHMPDSIEMSSMKDGQERRIGYKLQNWADVGGIKFAGTLQNIGLASEKITFADLKVSASPDEDLYTPPVGIQ